MMDFFNWFKNVGYDTGFFSIFFTFFLLFLLGTLFLWVPFLGANALTPR